MKQVFIAFTNYNKLSDVNHKSESINNFFNFSFNCNNLQSFPFIAIKEDGTYEKLTEIINTHDICTIVCYDLPNNENNIEYIRKIEILISSLLTSDTVVKVLHHINQNDMLLELLNSNDFILKPNYLIKKGMHIPGNVPYKGVIDILLASSQNANRDIEKLSVNTFKDLVKEKTFYFEQAYKLEIALNFLHECLNGKPSSLPEDFSRNNEIKLKFESWDGTDHLEDMRNLRDTVLEWAEAD